MADAFNAGEGRVDVSMGRKRGFRGTPVTPSSCLFCRPAKAVDRIMPPGGGWRSHSPNQMAGLSGPRVINWSDFDFRPTLPSVLARPCQSLIGFAFLLIASPLSLSVSSNLSLDFVVASESILSIIFGIVESA